MVANGVVYVLTDSNLLRAINAKTGAGIWSTAADTVFNDSMAAAHGSVYIGCDKALCAIDQVTGEFRWQTPLATERLPGNVLVANGLVYIGGASSGDLHAVDAKTGERKATLHTGTGGPMAVANGRLYVGSQSGQLRALAVNGGAGPASLKQASPPVAADLQPDLRLAPAVAVVSPANASN
jgi:outer membrane protein assembly factor BamB